MSVYIFTGKLGGGKTLCAVGRIQEKLNAGCRIATNLDLNLVNLIGRNAKNLDVVRLPDRPKIHDMETIGYGNTTYDESANGLLVLDECGTWFNSRNWNDKDRKPVNDWFLHARKYGWDVILIIQDIKLLDSQARNALAEHTAFCRRLDRVRVPLIGGIYKSLTGCQLTGPRLHVAKVVYGTSVDDLLADRHVYRGTGLYTSYNTKQLFLDAYEHGPYSMLTPWHTHGRYAVKHNREFYMRMTKIYWKRFKGPLAVGAGALAGSAISLFVALTLIDSTPVIADQVEPEIIAEVENDEPQTTAAELFQGYRVSAYMQSATRALVTLAGPAGEHYTDGQIRDLGYRANIVSNCKVVIRHQVNYYDSHTILAPACVERPFDKPAYKLSSLPDRSTNYVF